MNAKEFGDYLNHCKKDLIRSFNIAKKHYLSKFLRKGDEENKMIMQLMEYSCKDYLKKKLADIDKKLHH